MVFYQTFVNKLNHLEIKKIKFYRWLDLISL